MIRTMRSSTLVLASLASGCLVTADPVTYEPTQSPPIIVSSAVNPDPRGILRVGGDEGLDEFGITASIVSEDAGENVKVALYVDYGFTNALGQPFRFALQTFPELPPGTLSDGPRPLVGIRWVDVFSIQPGCHRLTLVATHAFDTASGCPKNLNDSSQITWHFRQCEEVGECPASLVDCPNTDASCPLEP